MLSNYESKRVYQIDGIKGLYIFLVVLGHLIGGGYNNKSILGVAHYFIYSIHMPMFVLISGLLSKNQTSFKKIIGNYVIPYIIFDLAYVLFGTIIGQSVSWNILVPSFAYWYILCIAIMKFVYSNVRIEIALVASVIISVLVIFFIPESAWRWLSIGRVALLYPVFLCGTLLGGNRLNTLSKNKVKCIAFGIVAMIILCVFRWFNVMPIDWATHDYYVTIMQLMIKYFCMLLTVAIFACLFCIIPKSSIMQRWGKNSIIIYLLHPFFVPFVRFAINKITNSEIMAFFITIVSALTITEILSINFFKKEYEHILEKVKQFIKLEV